MTTQQRIINYVMLVLVVFVFTIIGVCGYKETTQSKEFKWKDVTESRSYGRGVWITNFKVIQ